MKTHDEKVNELAAVIREMDGDVATGYGDIATAILAKIESMELDELNASEGGETGPVATVRRIAQRVQLGETTNAIRLLSLYGGLEANQRITDLIDAQKAELIRLRECVADRDAIIARMKAESVAAKAHIARLIAGKEDAK